MVKNLSNVRLTAIALMVGAVLAVPIARAAGPGGKPQSGTVTISQYQVAWMLSGNIGGGKLKYKGRTYDFEIGGLGIGGFGASKITAKGEVYGLKKVADFAGAYGQARYGAVAGDVSAGELWLENTKGVVLRLDAKRTGLALSLGADAIYVDFK
jgi:hypothetical protein